MINITDLLLENIIKNDIKIAKECSNSEYSEICNRYPKAFAIIREIKTINYRKEYLKKTKFEYNIKQKKNFLFLINGIKENIFNINFCVNKVFIKKESGTKYILKIIFNSNASIFINITLQKEGE